MALTQLRTTPLQLILFGGKGGVGKTTMAIATALQLSKEKRTLLFTTDPAPSLAENFGQTIGHKPTPITITDPEIGTHNNNLFAMEIDPRAAIAEVKETYARDILDILEQSTYLSKEETQKLFSLDLPGIDEIINLKKIIDLMETSDYDLYIVDTAPTGHTLRLLLLPELLDNWIKFFATLRWRYQAVARAFGGKQIEKADKFLLNMKKSVKHVRALLLNSEKTEFVAVTTPERSATSETGELLRSLERMCIPSRHIIINNIVPQEAPGSAEQWDRRTKERPRLPVAIPFIDTSIDFRRTLDYNQMRRKTQEKYIQQIQQQFSAHTITRVLLQPTEIQGLGTLQNLGIHLFSETDPPTS